MRYKNNKGFSVVELITTLFIMGLLLVFVAKMGRSNVQRAEFTSAVNGFLADLSLVRELAAKKNRYVAIDFSPDGTMYDIRIQDLVSQSMQDDNSIIHKTVTPLKGERFVEYPKDFMLNSSGHVYNYPKSSTDPDPVDISLRFIKLADESGGIVQTNYDYNKTLNIFPSGGIQIGDTYKENN